MAKIIGNTTATPNPRPDWNQSDPTKADYIKNKPTLGKGLSSNDFTDDLKTRLENNTFEDVIYLDESNPIQGTGLNDIGYKGVYKVSYNNNLYTGILIASYGIYVGDDYEELWSTQIFIDEGANIYYRISVADTYDWNEWEKISVSQTDLEDAIGDIETSLENIIKKYGLGGDGV